MFFYNLFMIQTKKSRDFKKGEMVFAGGARYFVDGVPKDLEKRPEWYLARFGARVFFAKHLTADVYPAAEMRSWLDDKKQPSESKVRRALIWSYDSFGDYSIKSGGGAVADSIFISHLKMTIADPRTGDDKDVVILKKYSNKFNEVLITVDEIERLQKATESDGLKNTRRIELLPNLLGEIIRAEKGIFSIGSGKGDWTREQIRQMKRQCSTDYTPTELADGLRKMANYAANFERRSPVGGTGQDFLDYLAAVIHLENPPRAIDYFRAQAKILPGGAATRLMSVGDSQQAVLPF